MRQRGFFTTEILLYITAGMGVALLLSGIGLTVQTSRLNAEKAAFSAFVAEVKVKGKAAEKAKADKEKQDKRNKERSDAEIKRLAALNQSLSDSLRNARTVGGYLPRASPGSGNPDIACFARAELESAIGRLDAGISGIALKGDQALSGLNAARDWAQAR